MAEVTYYWDSGSLITGRHWTYNAPAMWDGSLSTFASEDVNGVWQLLLASSCPGTDLGTITKVELRFYGYGDGDDRIGFRPIFGVYPNNPGDVHENTMPTSAGWSGYSDITNDTNAPSPWTWGAFQNLQCQLDYHKIGKGNIMYCAKVEIRVTYTPPAPPPEKVTQYLAGLDCPKFPHEMDLISDKLPCPPPYN